MSAPDLEAEVRPSTGGSPDELDESRSTHGGFRVRLENFEGPFDLLLQLISRHKMDVTEVALSRVTDEFLDHLKAHGKDWDLDQTSQLDDPEDLALLEARDLLFARLLQYRAFKQVAAYLATTLDGQGRRYPRQVGLEPRFARLLPEVTFSISPDEFAALAAKVFAPKQANVISLAHLHAPAVSVREQAGLLIARLRRAHTSTFRALTADSPNLLTTVARFLALLELFREGAVGFEQLTPLGELTVRWIGTDDGELAISDEFDDLHFSETNQRPGARDD